MNHYGRGGYFPDPFEADYLRASMYTHFEIDVYKYYQGDHSVLKILYLPRDVKSDGRQLLNVDEMESMIRSLKVGFGCLFLMDRTIMSTTQFSFTQFLWSNRFVLLSIPILFYRFMELQWRPLSSFFRIPHTLSCVLPTSGILGINCFAIKAICST